MLKKTLLFSLFLMAYSFMGIGQEYIVRYQTLSSGSIFHIETKDGTRLGKVTRELKNGSVVYSYFDSNGVQTATGRIGKYECETSIHVHDNAGKKIGWFSAQIKNVYPTEYRVFSPENSLIAHGWMNWLGSTFALANPDSSKHYFVTYFRPMFKLFNDHWHFDVHEEGVIEQRVLAMIGVFQSACDLKFEKLDY